MVIHRGLITELDQLELEQMILVPFFSEEIHHLPTQHSSILGNHGKSGSISEWKFLCHHMDYSLAVYIFRRGYHYFYQFLMIFWKEWTRSLTTMVHNGRMSSMSRQCFSLFPFHRSRNDHSLRNLKTLFNANIVFVKFFTGLTILSDMRIQSIFHRLSISRTFN